MLKKHNVILIGANRTAIDKAEDRQLFDETMQSINLETPASGIAHSMSDALEVQEKNRISMHHKTFIHYGWNWRGDCL